jgi:hypothetical protein
MDKQKKQMKTKNTQKKNMLRVGVMLSCLVSIKLVAGDYCPGLWNPDSALTPCSGSGSCIANVYDPMPGHCGNNESGGNKACNDTTVTGTVRHKSGSCNGFGYCFALGLPTGTAKPAQINSKAQPDCGG